MEQVVSAAKPEPDGANKRGLLQNTSGNYLDTHRIDEAKTLRHGLGFVPIVWVRNLPGGDDIDGACTFRPAVETGIEINYQLSQAGRGLKYSSDPTLLIREPAGVEGDLIRGGANALVVSDRGDAKLLEINGTAAAAVIEYVRTLRELALEGVHGNRSSADRISVEAHRAHPQIHDRDDRHRAAASAQSPSHRPRPNPAGAPGPPTPHTRGCLMTATETDDLPIDHAARAEALERRIAELEASHAARIIRTELRTEALRHGIVDLDGLKLVDHANLTIGEDGEVKGAAALMRDFKKSKPWLFGGASTSSTASAPPAQPPKQKLAKDMTHQEWQAARAELLKRR